MEKLLFGTAGVPNSTQGEDTISGIERIKQLGLDCMELEFVRGVHMSEERAEQVRESADKSGVALSVHAPYFINLNSAEEEKIAASIKRIYDSARIGAMAGAKSVVFHAGFYQGGEKRTVYEKIKSNIAVLIEKIIADGIDIDLRTELTGKPSQFGSFEELLELAREIKGVKPCIDFAHFHARTGGEINTEEEFETVIGRISKALGKQALKEIHIHYAGIKYGQKGEIKHLNLVESDCNYKGLVKVLKKRGVCGFLICESPNLEDDAMTLKREYEKAK